MVRMTPVLVAAALALVLPAAAQASPPKITWPAKRTYVRGDTLTVKVKATEPIRVALVRVSANNTVIRTIAKRKLRRGTFSAKLPDHGRFALRVGNRQRVVKVYERGAAPCPRGDSAMLQLSAPSVQVGGTLDYTIKNTSEGCLSVGALYTLARLNPDGTWTELRLPYAFPMPLWTIRGGATFPKTAMIPADASPGHYRLLDKVTGTETIPLAAEFDVIG